MRLLFDLSPADKAAFALNLRDYGTHIRVVYGFTTIPDEDFFRDHGEDDDDIKLRHAAIIRGDEDEPAPYRRCLSSTATRPRTISSR